MQLKNQIMKQSPNELKMRYLAKELKGLRKVLTYLYDGEQEAFNILYFIKSNYKEWDKMLLWLKNNNLRGKKLVQMFQNESTTDGGGYHLGATHILSRLKGMKTGTVGIKINELIGA